MKILKSLLASALLAAAGASQAAVVDFYYNGNVSATMTTSGGTNFQLDFLSAPLAGAFINGLYLAGPGGTFSDNSTQTTISATYDANGFVNAGKVFNWELDFPQPNNVNRFTVGETALWSIVVTDPNAWDFNMLHINAFYFDQSTGKDESIKLDGCVRGTPGCGGGQVPEPGALALLGLGLAALGLARRRRV